GRPLSELQDVEKEHVPLAPNSVQSLVLAGDDHACMEPAFRQLLSRRERQVLVYLARGDSNKMIARRCEISEATVKVHLKAILRKIAAHNRTQAAIWALENGLHSQEAMFSTSKGTLPESESRSESSQQGPLKISRLLAGH